MVDPDSGRVPRAPPYSGTASARRIHFAYGALTLFGAPSQTLPLCIRFLQTCRVIPMRPFNPAYAVWAAPRSLAATCGISGGSLLFLISFPELLRWFTSLSLAPAAYFIRLFRCMPHGMRVTPFGSPGIVGCLLLPPAFRSLPRPSSPSGSQASTINLYSLDHIIFSSCAGFLPLLQARPARYGTPRSPRRIFQPSSGYLCSSSQDSLRILPFLPSLITFKELRTNPLLSFFSSSGDKGIRTPDPRLAKPML